MPILPSINNAPYDTVEDALDLARARINDAIASIGGEVLTNDAVFTQPLTNGAWRRMAEFLGNQGYTRFIGDVLIQSLPIVANPDPASQCSLNWNGYFNGVVYSATPALPPDLIEPLKIWERPTGANWPFPVHPNTENMVDGLPSTIKQLYNRNWEWRQDTLWIPGALQVVDLRLRYITFIADFVDQGPTSWFQQQIPVARCLSPFSKYIAYEACFGRGDVDAQTILNEAEAEARMVMNRGIRAKQRVNIRRQPRGGSRGRGWC